MTIKSLQDLIPVLARIRKLELSAQQIKEQWQEYKESESLIRDELNKLTKKDLLKYCGFASMSEKKDKLVKQALDNLKMHFVPGNFIWSPMSETADQAIERHVQSWTDEMIEAKRNPPPPPPPPVQITPPPQPQEPTPEDIGKEWIAKNKPEWAVAAIVAELYHDDSDPMTDYFAGYSTKTVVLAWSKHERDLFPEMRKAADLYEPTHHLGSDKGDWRIYEKGDPNATGYAARQGRLYTHYVDGVDGEESISRWTTQEEAEAVAQSLVAQDKENHRRLSAGEITGFCPKLPFGYEIKGSTDAIEHREKYSMGQGYYLGTSRHGGWRVSKALLKHNLNKIARAISEGSHTLDRQPQSAQPSFTRKTDSTTTGTPEEPLNLPDGVTLNIIPSYHAKKQVDIWVVQISDRVDRAVYNSLNARAKEVGGYYSSFTRNGAIPGFVFWSEDAAKVFCEA